MKKLPIDRLAVLLSFAAILVGVPVMAGAQTALLNVSYDVTREFYKDYNPLFSAYWKRSNGTDVVINQSHGGAGAQARAVADGLQADVVTLNQPTDIDSLAERHLVAANWSTQFPNASAPNYSMMVLVVRHGNPKHIHDWDDLIRDDISVIAPNPKTSGGGRYAYLGAWGFARKKLGSDAAAAQFVGKIYAHVPVLDTGSRGSTTTFVQRGIGDVLIAFESEALAIDREFDAGKVEIVYPSISVEADNPVAVVDSVVDKKHTRAVAHAYLDYLYSEPAQTLAAQHHLRVRSPAVMQRFETTLKPVKLFTVEEVFGDWKSAQHRHFEDGAQYDQLVAAHTKH